ncbi:MFS transporter [Acetobacterium sp. KB-1]|jgi:predicted MFS family arabinose efflux permease|uniref:MFS transporter n=1 Tax=Acetobacterium sp. KB-1 TaxID=2184575 RepID=UPI000DBECE5C|nr:MFS transporter [Acetobacterium sp. KB-1]AWW26503.1 hypothetical protein DOZ58_07445 [Acetobacterium sp. KB-1]
MNISLSKSRTFLFLLAIFLTNVCTMADFAIIPAVGGLFETFDNVTLVTLIVTGPSLLGVFFCILGGRLADKYNKKALLVFGFGMFTVSSILGATFDNVWYVLILRMISGGISWGFTSSASLAIVAEVYLDENKRGTVMGWYNSAMAAIGAILSFIAGLLAVTSWQNAYSTYWVAAPILVLVILFVPNLAKAEKLIAVNVSDGNIGSIETNVAVDKTWVKKFVPLLAAFFSLGIVYYIIVYQIALYVAATGIGNEAISGTLGSLGTIGSGVIGLMFGLIFGKLHRATIIPTYIIFAVGFFALFISTSFIVTAICCTLLGAAWGNAYSFYYVRATIIVPPSFVATAIGAVSAASGIAVFLSNFVANYLKGLLGTDIVGILPVLAGISSVGAVLSILLTVKNRKEAVEMQY